MNREYNSRVSSKNSERLLKNLENTTGDYFFPHPVQLSGYRTVTSVIRPTRMTALSIALALSICVGNN